MLVLCWFQPKLIMRLFRYVQIRISTLIVGNLVIGFGWMRGADEFANPRPQHCGLSTREPGTGGLRVRAGLVRGSPVES